MDGVLCALQAVDSVGEILLSLSYLPTAERLTVVVVKAKNLVWTNSKMTAGKCVAVEEPLPPEASWVQLPLPEQLPRMHLSSVSA